jgi:signal transduction histidine kinase
VLPNDLLTILKTLLNPKKNDYLSELYLMKLKRIYFWFIAISILMITLTGIQVYWLKKNAAMQQKETNARINKAIENAGNELEHKINCIEGYSKSFIDTTDRFYMIKQHTEKGNQPVSQDTLQVVFDPFTLGLKKDTLIADNSGKYSYPFSLEMKLNFHFPFSKMESNLLHQNNFLNIKTARTFQEAMASKLSITSLLNMRFADSIIFENLKKQQINSAAFGFGFLGGKNNRILFSSRVNDSMALKKSAYFTDLFADNKFMSPYRLAIVLPFSDDMFMFNGVLLLAVGIILLLTAAFYLFGRLYIRQTQLSEMKTDFINNLTHEFNTPMANIGLAVETLNDYRTAHNPKIAQVIRILSSESFRLRENIERILQVATLEKCNLHLEKEMIDLVPLVTTVITGFQLQCEELGGSISFTYPDHAMVSGDEVHLLNCICNLLDNAIKYRQHTPVIEIVLAESGGKVYLQVIDNGIGMSHETQQHIFEKFYRAHQGNIHNTKGFGLGLNYVKGIIDLHSGKIIVQSKAGSGSKFTIQLPAAEHGVNG